MPAFSQRSLERLRTCDPDLIRLFNRVVERFDCTVLEGHRGQEAQDEAFRTGRSQLKWPDGDHNRVPSTAVDVAPYPVDWHDIRRFDHFAGFVRGVASEMGLSIRWGGDWDGDTQVRDQRFNDLVHYEVVRD
jgi:peptidoglycan L-alanyl-D-glutamate endopeptidase CwlK